MLKTSELEYIDYHIGMLGAHFKEENLPNLDKVGPEKWI